MVRKSLVITISHERVGLMSLVAVMGSLMYGKTDGLKKKKKKKSIYSDNRPETHLMILTLLY